MPVKNPINAYRAHQRVHPPVGGPSLTKQAFAAEVDINNILRKHEAGELVSHVNVHQGDYGNFIAAQDYHTSMNLIEEAKRSFMTIPADVRAMFDNDPQKFLAFAQNPDNLEEMIEIGLAPPRALQADPENPGTRIPQDTLKEPPAAPEGE